MTEGRTITGAEDVSDGAVVTGAGAEVLGAGADVDGAVLTGAGADVLGGVETGAVVTGGVEDGGVRVGGVRDGAGALLTGGAGESGADDAGGALTIGAALDDEPPGTIGVTTAELLPGSVTDAVVCEPGVFEVGPVLGVLLPPSAAVGLPSVGALPVVPPEADGASMVLPGAGRPVTGSSTALVG